MDHGLVILQHDGGEVALGHVTAHGPCDLDLVDRLARIHLAALRTGGSIVLRDPSAALRELLVLAGLDDLLTGSSRRGFP